MDVQEIAPHLWHWTAPHPEWKPSDRGEDGLGWDQIVSSYAVITDDAFVLIDPQVPTDEADAARFWEALDRDVEAHGPPAVLITIKWHLRSAPHIAERYDGTRTWAPVSVGDELPGGVVPHELPGGEMVLEVPQHRALVFGDAVLDGPRLCPDSWLAKGTSRDDLVAAIRPLLEGNELLLLTHGGPAAAADLEV
jgi:glyoxylase-like metal-dependent hydrolase (beta-lactamase superfamily II)